MSETERPSMAKSWRVEPGVGLIVDDRVFPWYVAADPGPMVEPGECGMHILWLPMLMVGDIPEYGRPNGEPAATDESPDLRSPVRSDDGGE